MELTEYVNDLEKLDLSKIKLEEAILNYLQVSENLKISIDDIETNLIVLISNCTNNKIILCR